MAGLGALWGRVLPFWAGIDPLSLAMPITINPKNHTEVNLLGPQSLGLWGCLLSYSRSAHQQSDSSKLLGWAGAP